MIESVLKSQNALLKRLQQHNSNSESRTRGKSSPVLVGREEGVYFLHPTHTILRLRLSALGLLSFLGTTNSGTVGNVGEDGWLVLTTKTQHKKWDVGFAYIFSGAVTPMSVNALCMTISMASVNAKRASTKPADSALSTGNAL